MKAAASGRSLEFLELALPFLLDMIDLLPQHIRREAPLEVVIQHKSRKYLP